MSLPKPTTAGAGPRHAQGSGRGSAAHALGVRARRALTVDAELTQIEALRLSAAMRRRAQGTVAPMCERARFRDRTSSSDARWVA